MRAPNQFRKLVYGLIIVAIFGAMIPYTKWLNDEKQRKDLGEAAIGQVDTGSFMLKLALLGGARGVAANVLWTRAIDLQKVQEWDRLKATVDLITKLQPHFLAVWTFQSWNLAYNVSAEWDAPEDKYEWIKQGIKFVEQGVDLNRKSPDLIWDTASIYYHKIGFADEAIILRRLFRDDDDEKFKTSPIDGLPRNDNFQLAYGWFVRSVNLVDSGQNRVATEMENEVNYVDAPVQRKGRPGDLNFRSMPAHAQTRYAAGLEKQSVLGVPATFGEVARNEWYKTFDEWVKFGSYEYLSHNELDIEGVLIRQPIKVDDVSRPAEFEKLVDNIPYWTEVTKVPNLTKDDCARLTANKKYWTGRWSDQMNYTFWKDRAAAEMEPDGVRARQLFYEGTKAYKSADLAVAGQKFKEGLAIWEKLLERHPVYRDDDLNKKDTGLILKRYLRVLQNLNEPIPDNLPFKSLRKAAEQELPPDPFDELEMLPSRSRQPE
ncbi:MAG TPA: hypothetical protein VGZ22_01295 [Isosphaeraceae bacterium]|nr:hypothetical protein [Isosphaeraceae bacterium]